MSFWVDDKAIGEDIVCLALHGPLDNFAFEVLEHAIEQAQQDRKVKIIVDLSDVPRVSSVGIGVLISAQTDLKEQARGALVLVAPQPSVLKVFEVMEYTTVFSVADSVEDAVRLLGP